MTARHDADGFYPRQAIGNHQCIDGQNAVIEHCSRDKRLPGFMADHIQRLRLTMASKSDRWSADVPVTDFLAAADSALHDPKRQLTDLAEYRGLAGCAQPSTLSRWPPKRALLLLLFAGIVGRVHIHDAKRSFATNLNDCRLFGERIMVGICR